MKKVLPPGDAHRISSTLGWLLEEGEPSIRYLALTQLLGKGEDDEEVRSAKHAIGKTGWAADILAKESPAGWWVAGDSLYRPKYISSNWMLLILSDVGMTKKDERIRTACELWIGRFAKEDGGFGADGSKSSHLCMVGNTARALVKFGYGDHPTVERAFDWLAKNAAPLGGWSCFGSGRNLDSWEPMSAFAVYPRHKWTKGMKEAVEKGSGVLPAEGAPRAGRGLPPVVSLPLPNPLLLRPAGGIGFHDGSRIRRRQEAGVRHLTPQREAPPGRKMEPRFRPP